MGNSNPIPAYLSFVDVLHPTLGELIAFAKTLGATYREDPDTMALVTCSIVFADGTNWKRQYRQPEGSGYPTMNSARIGARWELEAYRCYGLSPNTVTPRTHVAPDARVTCARFPDTHGFHPASGRCPYCP